LKWPWSRDAMKRTDRSQNAHVPSKRMIPTFKLYALYDRPLFHRRKREKGELPFTLVPLILL